LFGYGLPIKTTMSGANGNMNNESDDDSSRRRDISRGRSSTKRKSIEGAEEENYSDIFQRMTTPQKKILLQLTRKSLSGNGVAMAGENVTPPLTHYQQQARESYDEDMQKAGLKDSKQSKERRVAKYVRKVLFKKVKFFFDKDHSESGKVALTMCKYLMWDKRSFNKEWLAWMGNLVRSVINEKRGGCNQLIATSVCTCKFKLMMNTYM